MEKEEKITEQKSYTTITTIEIETQQIKWSKKVTIVYLAVLMGYIIKKSRKNLFQEKK